METREIKSLMMLKDITSASIAKKEHVTRTWVYLVLHGKRNSPRIQKAIAKAIGKPFKVVWPKSSRPEK